VLGNEFHLNNPTAPGNVKTWSGVSAVYGKDYPTAPGNGTIKVASNKVVFPKVVAIPQGVRATWLLGSIYPGNYPTSVIFVTSDNEFITPDYVPGTPKTGVEEAFSMSDPGLVYSLGKMNIYTDFAGFPTE